MSLVGTRPPTLDEWEKYEPHHRARMSFRPGLRGNGCLQVLREMQSILISRGFENGFTIPAN